MIRVFEGELPQHGMNIAITVLRRLTDYTKDQATTDNVRGSSSANS
jgi:hypothetical protein